MRKSKSVWLLIVLVLLGATIGGFIGQLLSKYEFFSWMSLGGSSGYRELFSFSFNPLFDAHVLSMDFGMTLRVNAGSIIGMILAIILYYKK
ncbi:MAG: DUF4321 domain-containing protein [Eubacteriales bacterium]|nr:DUF4321 domain-containing protein [Eubacteriales bacterium]